MDAGTAPMINEGVWVALSFIAFVALVWKRAGSALSAMFDKRADDIRKALDEAHQLREEAQAELTKYQKLNREAMQEAEQITANAVAAAEVIREKAEENAKAAIARRSNRPPPRSRPWKLKRLPSFAPVRPSWPLPRPVS